MLLSKKSSVYIAAFVSIFILFSACGSDHDHGPTPVGLEILQDGQVIAIQEGTEITYPGGNSAIQVNQDESIVIQVQFFTDDGERYNYSTDDGYALQYNITDQSVIQVDHPVNNSEWNLRIHGQSQGSSSINFELWHVDHSDFESRDFQISVN